MLLRPARRPIWLPAAILSAVLLLGAAAAPPGSWAGDVVEMREIIQRLTPPPRPHRTRSIAIQPTDGPTDGSDPATVPAAPSIDLDILFDYNSDRLTPQAAGQLNALGAALASTELGGYR